MRDKFRHNTVRTSGDWYDWCHIREDGTLEFGSEDGNYSGGTTLSVEFTLGRDYWGAVADNLRWWEKYHPAEYAEIIQMIESAGFSSIEDMKQKLKGATMSELSILLSNLADDKDWAEANEWECPITLGQDLKGAIATIKDARNELCMKCGRYHGRHLGNCDGCRWRDLE